MGTVDLCFVCILSPCGFDLGVAGPCSVGVEAAGTGGSAGAARGGQQGELFAEFWLQCTFKSHLP